MDAASERTECAVGWSVAADTGQGGGEREAVREVQVLSRRRTQPHPVAYDRLAALDLTIDGSDLTRHERDTSSGFTRATTVVALHGDGCTGRGEDVTYDTAEHDALADADSPFDLLGTYTLDEFSTHIAEQDLFRGREPDQVIFRNYRRWALESAALDLALRQADTDLASRLGRSYDPVRFVVSTRLGDPPTGDRVLDWLDRDPSLEFKLDPTSNWTAETVERLASTEAVKVLDLKGQYHGTTVDQPADPALYQRVVEEVPDALIEDPDLTEETHPLFAGHEGRVTWDYPIRGVETVQELPWEPEWLNIKPSRFGSVRSLFRTLDYCREHGIRCFGGGQFELGVGREHIHALASCFYPEAPNDVAPGGYNDPDPPGDLPSSPLEPPADPDGLGWGA